MKTPITKLLLYKHGIGFITRRGKFNGDKITLLFDKKDINDVLKSLSFKDYNGGKVLGIDYDSPKDKKDILEKTNIVDNLDQGLQSIWNSTRGQSAQVKLKNGSIQKGIIAAWQEKTLTANAILSLLNERKKIELIGLEEVESIEFLSEEIERELKHFLDLVNLNEKEATLLIRLNEGEHDLELSYTSPAPVWKISYRIDLRENKMIFSAWCIFENTYPEDLTDVEITLVSGMPISFIYQLYESYTPTRIKLKEESRMIETPIEFESVVRIEEEMSPEEKKQKVEELAVQQSMMREAALRVMEESGDDDAEYSMSREPSIRSNKSSYDLDFYRENANKEEIEFKPSTHFDSVSKDEFFEYKLKSQISVSRSKTAMIPLLELEMEYKKELIYNHEKYKLHPIFVIRFINQTGVILETGPVTIFENAKYSGESILRINPDGANSVLSYAVDLTVQIKVENSSQREFHSIGLEKGNLFIYEYEISMARYTVLNKNKAGKRILIEHSKSENVELFDTIKPFEETLDDYRFELNIPADTALEFIVKERRLISRNESIANIGYANFQKMLNQKIIPSEIYNKVAPVFQYKQEIVDLETKIGNLKSDKEELFKKQDNIRKNITALRENSLEQKHRANLVEELIQNENKIKDIQSNIENSKLKVQSVNRDLIEYLEKLK